MLKCHWCSICGENDKGAMSRGLSGWFSFTKVRGNKWDPLFPIIRPHVKLIFTTTHVLLVYCYCMSLCNTDIRKIKSV